MLYVWMCLLVCSWHQTKHSVCTAMRSLPIQSSVMVWYLGRMWEEKDKTPGNKKLCGTKKRAKAKGRAERGLLRLKCDAPWRGLTAGHHGDKTD